MTQSARRAIRSATVGDAEPLAELLDQLGYPASASEVRLRLERLLPRADTAVFVAEDGGEVVGVAAYQLILLLERTRPQCRLTTLVVRSDQRRSGVARELVSRVEADARAADCFRLEVTTQSSREDALAFYAAAGFIERRQRLVKMLEQ